MKTTNEPKQPDIATLLAKPLTLGSEHTILNYLRPPKPANIRPADKETANGTR